MRRLLAVSIIVWDSVIALPAAQSGQPASQAWNGTVTVTRKASGAIKAGDGKGSLGFNGSETIIFQLAPDGTAAYTATYSSAWDMSGQYSIPSHGSGSGTTTYGIAFNGVNWEVGIDGGDNIETEEDHTAEDLWWANQFRELIELAEAVDGKKSVPYNGRFEKSGRSVNGAAFASSERANAKSLSGSHTEKLLANNTEGLDGPPIPMTLTISWNLSRGPVQPKVAVHGPPCGCLDAEDPESTPLKFVAGSTVRGGEFSEFEVIPDGKPPEIISNEGGEQAELVLAGTKETGAVTLKIHYTKDGRRYDAVPQRVEFCTLQDIELKDDEHDLAFTEESLDVSAKSKAWHNGQEVSTDIDWDLEKMGEPTKLTSDPVTPKGEKITFTYKGLPAQNDSFGPKRLTATIERGKCHCQKSRQIRTFFVGDDESHPGPGSTPNWYFYWKQTDAATSEARRIMEYRETLSDPNLPNARPIAKYDPETEKLFVSRLIHEEHGCRDEVDRSTHAPTGRHAEGIDCFAETVRHEWQHRQDAIAWWESPAGQYSLPLVEWLARDWDHDMVPNTVESAEPGCKSGAFVSVTASGGQETWFTCTNRPFADATDAEINAYWSGWTWPIGSVNKVDWSCGPLGKQWRGKTCGK